MDNSKKELLFAVTREDCDWTYYIASGNGGQNRQKTSSAARCIHRASKAEGKSSESRSQWDNRKTAFKRMTETKEFKIWLKMEMARKLRDEAQEEKDRHATERYVENAMKEENIRSQIKIDGKWVDTDNVYWKNLNE